MNSFGWVGGKRLLRKKIAELIPTDIDCYVEPFGGAGWVLFHKDRWASCEVYNDADKRLVTLFRIAKYHSAELLREMECVPNSRLDFEDFRDQEGLTDVQRAARFFYLVTRSFGAKAKGFQYGTSKRGGGGAYISIFGRLALVDQIWRRLDKVNIECLDFEACIERYDHKRTFFYCDPPYMGGSFYLEDFSVEDHQRLRKALGKIKGRFLLSYDDSPEVRILYEGFAMMEAERLCGINRKNIKKGVFRELLIRNYEPGK